MLKAGSYLQERYEILEQIGSGGMSVVYKAKCHKLNRLVAIKVLKNEFSNDPAFVSKFKMEAQAAAGLSHPNIVSVYDVVDEGELHFIVMEIIEGITLKNYIIKKGCLEAKETIGIAIQVAQGIAAAHEQRIIHRDIKPQNMIISKDGKVKVADFGIARAVSEQTINSNVMGSVHYISPEQARGGYSDARSDIYSLGITMYEMVTGHVPFQGENTVTVALQHLEEPIVPPSVYNQQIPVSLERIILKCTEKSPENRYDGVSSLNNDLRRALLFPDDAFVADETKQHLGETVMMNDAEMVRIKEHKRVSEHPRATPYQDIVRRDSSYPRPGEHPESGIHQYPAYPDAAEADTDSGRTDQRVSRHIERLLAAGGIIVAILVVAVMIVVAYRLVGGFLNPRTDPTLPAETAESAAPTTTAAETADSTQTSMPDVRELNEDIAEAKLKESTLSMKRTYEYSDQVEAGYVISQDPEAGEMVSKWSSVNVVVSNGSDKIDLLQLDLLSLDGIAAKNLLESLRLQVELTEEESEIVAAGKVIGFTPERVAEGGTVILRISTGPQVVQVPVPELKGLTEAEAAAQLTELGLTPNAVSEHSDTVPEGYVVSQTLPAETMADPGSTVDFVISLGPERSNIRYVASINATYDISRMIGPGSPNTEISLMIRLHQVADGEDYYTELMAPRRISGDTLLPIQYSSIEGIPGIDNGTLEVVKSESGEVLKSYPLTFFPMN